MILLLLFLVIATLLWFRGKEEGGQWPCSIAMITGAPFILLCVRALLGNARPFKPWEKPVIILLLVLIGLCGVCGAWQGTVSTLFLIVDCALMALEIFFQYPYIPKEE